jgi:hypothetical protein
MAAPALIPVPCVCCVCGCSQFDACVDPETGETCGWADARRTLCTFCAALSGEMHAALDEGPQDDEEPRVVLATEAECSQYIRELREGN